MQEVIISIFDKEGASLQYKEHTRHTEGPTDRTKNGRAIESLVYALKRLKKPCKITVKTDSAYLYGPITNEWVKKWAESGWINAKGQEVANGKHWREHWGAIQGHEISVVLEGRENGKEKEKE